MRTGRGAQASREGGEGPEALRAPALAHILSFLSHTTPTVTASRQNGRNPTKFPKLAPGARFFARRTPVRENRPFAPFLGLETRLLGYFGSMGLAGGCFWCISSDVRHQNKRRKIWEPRRASRARAPTLAVSCLLCAGRPERGASEGRRRRLGQRYPLGPTAPTPSCHHLRVCATWRFHRTSPML